MLVTGALDVLISKLVEKISNTFQLVASTILIYLVTTGVKQWAGINFNAW